MKICDLTQSYAPRSGGIRTYIQAKRKFILQNTPHEHLLIVPGDQDTVFREGRLTTITVQAKPIKGCEPYRFIWRIDKVARWLLQERPDVIELGSAYVLPYAAFYYRTKHPVPVIGFYHTDYPSAYVQPAIQKLAGPFPARLAMGLSTLYVRAIYSAFDATITSSSELYRKLRGMGMNHVHHVPLGVDLERFHPQRRNDMVRQQLGVNSDDLLLVFSGRLDAEKRVDVLLEAFDRASARLNCHLLLIGQGPLQTLAQQWASRNPRIKVLPYQTDRDRLAELLASSDIYVTAGPHETFGLAVIEAQACGLAVAGVRAGALIERVPQSAGLLAAPDSATSLADGIYELATNGYLIKGRQARQWVETRFAWENTFNRLLTLYDQFSQKYCQSS